MSGGSALLVCKLRRDRDILPSDSKRKIYNAILLHLDYCCVVWQECSLEMQRKIESIQNWIAAHSL